MESRFVSISNCFYHNINRHNNFVLYRVKYSTTGHREFTDRNRPLCVWCYNFLGPKLKMVDELKDLKNMKNRHPNFRYIMPMKSSNEMTVVWGMPNKIEWDTEEEKTSI